MRIVGGVATRVTSPTFLGLDQAPANLDAGVPVCTGLATATGLAVPLTGVAALAGAPGVYTAVLSPQVALGPITVTWTGTVAGHTQVLTRVVEVVEGHYASLAELQTMPDLDDVPVVELIRGRDAFADLVEAYRGASWVGRVTVEAHDLPLRLAAVLLERSHPRLLIRLVVDGVAFVPSSHRFDTLGRLWLPSIVGRRLEVTYSYGRLDGVPAALRDACLEYVRSAVLATDSGIPRNALSWGDGQGGTYRTSTADWNAGRPTGLMAVDALLNQIPDHRLPGIA